MKQKLALSCSLVHRPDVLFLDEPTTGVDAVSRKEFWDLLAGLRDSGLTIIVSTPYMDEASRCNRVALMQEGRILAIDEPGKIGRLFKYPLFAVKRAERLKLINALRKYPHARSVYPFGEDLHYADMRTDASREQIESDLQSYAASEGLAGLQIRSIEAGIEDAFMELMGHPADAAA
jgi:ABC-type multidrug transport system ATPase subunit